MWSKVTTVRFEQAYSGLIPDARRLDVMLDIEWHAGKHYIIPDSDAIVTDGTCRYPGEHPLLKRILDGLSESWAELRINRVDVDEKFLVVHFTKRARTAAKPMREIEKLIKEALKLHRNDWMGGSL